jgi:hypothetical protein
MITLKGKSYRPRERGLDVTPAAQPSSPRDSASTAEIGQPITRATRAQAATAAPTASNFVATASTDHNQPWCTWPDQVDRRRGVRQSHGLRDRA